MSFPLPYVLVLLNLLCRPALLCPMRLPAVSSSSCRLPRCLLACLVSSRLSSCLSTRRAGRLGDWRCLLAIADVVRMSCGCVFLGSLCSPSVHRPAARHGWRGGERRFSLLASFGFLPSAALVSVRVGWAWSACLFLRHRSDFSCDARFL